MGKRPNKQKIPKIGWPFWPSYPLPSMYETQASMSKVLISYILNKVYSKVYNFNNLSLNLSMLQIINLSCIFYHFSIYV